MEDITTFEAAKGFFGGCVFMASVLWSFIVLPKNKRIEQLEDKITATEDREREFLHRFLRKAGYDV